MNRTAVPTAIAQDQERPVVRGAGWASQSLHTAGGMLVFQALTLVTAVLIARGLGPESQGRFQLLMSVAVLVVMGVKLGLDEGLSYVLPRYSVTQPAQMLSLVGYSVGFTVGLSVFAGIGIYAAAGVLGRYVFPVPGFETDLRQCLWLVPALMLMLMGTAVLRGLNRSDLRAYVYYYGVSAAFLAAVLLLDADGRLLPSEVYDARIATYAAGGVVSLALALPLMRMKPAQVPRSELRLLHSFSGLVLISALFQYAIQQPLIDLMIVGWTASAADVGIYSVAAKVGLLTALAVSAITIAIAPSVVRLGVERRREELIWTHRTSSRAAAVFAVVVGLALLTFAKPVLSVFGPAYNAGTWVLTVLVCGQIVAGTLGMSRPFLLAAGRAGLDCLVTGASALVLLAGGFLLGSLYGPAGVAAATATATVGTAAARRLLCSRALGLSVASEEIRRGVLAALSVVALLTAQQVAPAAGVATGIVAIVGWIAASGGFRPLGLRSVFVPQQESEGA